MSKTSFHRRVAGWFAVLSVFGVISGCAPRGESHTVDQILSDARSAYQDSASKAAADDTASLKNLSASLDRLAGIGGGGDAKAVSGEIAQTLTGLSTKAGYTVRPAMAELVSQYRSVSENAQAGASIGAPHLKLLVARTYSLIASELKTTGFRVS
jgi:hypothetical protein